MSSLGEAAYRLLRAEIVTCRLAPGERLTERQLSARTGFGISPVRDALTRLDQDGLVQTLPRRGYHVTPMTPGSIDELLDAWSVLGPELARRGVRQADDRQRARLAEGFTAVDELSRQTPGPELAFFIVARLDEVFTTLVEAAGNRYLHTMYRGLSGDLSRLWVLTLSADPSLVGAESVAGLLTAIGQPADGDALARSVTRTLASFRALVQQTVMRWPSVTEAPLRAPDAPA
ncbi:GntR family transcriptional regulator [Klenkia sp. LSe6-5]|uniref:GntR family transcriptional regulator n=1 Tax=Klenkia sesuvii TaxID=3103137 RepID=A0ABU8DQQ9_9ACTN